MKYYGDFQAVKGVSFDVPRGGVFGLLGPNGAGKSTTIKIIVGLLHPSSGDVNVGGHRAGSIKARNLIGYAPEHFSISEKWRLIDFMEYVCFTFGYGRHKAIEKSMELLEWVGLENWADERFGELSAGMRRRLGIAQALVGDPEILILDEPTEHLDALGRIEVMNKIRDLAERAGKTVLISTHVLAEAEQMVDGFVIMHKGKLIYQGDLTSLVDRESLRLEVDKPDMLIDGLRTKFSDISISRIGVNVIIDYNDIDELNREIMRIALDKNIKIISLELMRPSLSEFFVKVVGEA